MASIVIIGASGHGKVVADIAHLCGYEDICFVDDNPGLTECGGRPVVGTTSQVVSIPGEVFVAIGNASIRRRVMQEYSDRDMPVLIHPKATVAGGVVLGPGSVVMAGAVINSDAVLGQGCIVNTSASVDHDCRLGDYVHVSVGAHLCGTVSAGDYVWIGAGATVSNNISICSGCTVGAGATVVRSIETAGTYVGTPAKRLD